ncbi:alpha-2-macroglobulin [Caldimonas tepidiphila]|uniref:alpha-2-macroglobulin n=1 Tax=Caldimonas tepidiphila TaxID=2315841 RepID=UPI000E5BC12B|nr:alpha-2-macroglobulin [Caldimonas tepidiphila]
MAEDAPELADETRDATRGARLRAGAARLGAGLLALLRALFGVWQPPGWLRWLGRGLRHAGGGLRPFAARLVLVLLAAGALTAAWPRVDRWWHGLRPDAPQLVELSFRVTPPPRTRIEDEAGPNPLVIDFPAPAARLERVGKDPGDMRITPEVAGRWSWASPQQLVFRPAQDWPVGQAYTVELGRGSLAPQVRLKEDSFRFSAPPFTAAIDGGEFYQDPVQPDVRRVVFQLRFSHPVSPSSLESRLRLEDGSGGLGLFGLGSAGAQKFSISYDKLKLQASVMSEPLPIPDLTRPMRLTLAAGVSAARGGEPSKDEQVRLVDVPGLYSLAIAEVGSAMVSNDKGEPEQVLQVAASMPVHEREMARAVSAWMLPVAGPEGKEGAAHVWSDPQEVDEAVLERATALKLEPLPGEREVGERGAFRMPQAEGGRFVYVRVARGLKTPGGYQLGAPHVQVLQLKTSAPELAIMSRGSLLALSGERKLPLLVRDLPGVRVEIARLLPQQLHLLASQTGGDFSRPRFHGSLTADALSERFERRIALKLPPGRTHYETVDFGAYLKSEAGERRGVFLLSVTGDDPKRGGEGADPYAGDAHRGYHGEEDHHEAHEGEGEGEAEATVDPARFSDRRLVLVTDLGLIAKRAADGTRDVFVQSVASGAPVGAAVVEVWGRNGLVLASVATDAGGRARLPSLEGMRRERQPVLLVARKDGDLSFLPLERHDRQLDLSRFDVGGLRSAGVPNQMSAYLFSDRGIYRPGDTMRIGAIVKAGNWATTLADMPVEAEVSDARGLSVRREILRLGPGGALEFEHTTQEESPTGNYTVTLSLPRQGAPGAPELPRLQLGTLSVKMQEFLPDRTRVAARLSAEVAEGWVSPKDLKASVDVQNLFGTPAQGRRVESRLTLRPAYPAFRSHPDYAFYDPQAVRQPQEDELGAVETDAQGRAELDLQLGRFQAATYQLHLVVKAFEPEGGRSVAAEARTLVSDLPFLVGAKAGGPLDYVARGAARQVHLIAIDARAQRISAGKLKLERVERRMLSVLVKQPNGLYRYESRPKEVLLREQPFSIAAAGTALALETGTPGHFAYVVRDARGLALNRIEYSVAGAANLGRSLDRNAELQVKLDKRDYLPGDEIQLSIQAPYSGAGLITIERDKVYAHAWFKAEQTASVQRITLPKDFEGNGYVSVQFVRDPASDEIYTSPLSHGVAPFAISLARRTANIALESTPLVKPGQAVKMTLRADRPVRAVVFAVDEGILQVARYQNPDPLRHFFQKRALEVGTMQTLDLILPEFRKLMQSAAPGGDAEGALGKHLNPFKRKRDKPVAFWSGFVDVSGSREFSYTVPESFNGELRVLAVAVNDEGAAAAATRSTVRGELVLLPNVPLAISPGDTVEVGVGVANNIAGSGRDAPIQLALSVTGGLEVVGEPRQVLKISEHGEGKTKFRIRARADAPGQAPAQLGSASVILVAQRGASSARLSTDVSVRPASAYVTRVQSGVMVGGGELKAAADVYPQFSRSEFAVSATPWSFASALMQYLVAYPYGCTEQITSQTAPSVVLSNRPELAREIARGATATGEKVPDPRRTWERYLTQLRARQQADGGIAPWPGGGADYFPTVYAMQWVVEARERGLPVPQDLLARANTYLQGGLDADHGQAHDWRSRAQAAYVLTRQGVQVPAALAQLRGRVGAGRALATDLGAAYLAASYRLLRQDGVAAELMGPVWAELQERMRKGGRREIWGPYHDPLVHDAMLVFLAARHFPELLSGLPPQTWERLAGMIRDGWYSSVSSASTILAVDAYSQAAAQAARGAVQVLALGAQGRSQALPLGEIKPMARTAVPAGSTALRLSGGAGLPLFYAWAESGYERGVPDAALAQGLEIAHEVLDAQGRPVTQARLGEELTMRVRVRSVERAGIEQVAIVDVLPGGLEPVLQPLDGGEAGEAPRWRRRLGGAGTWEAEYADVREDRVLFFGRVDRQMREISYKVRATNVGEFTHPAAYGEAMYERRVFARSAGGRFTVTPLEK